jgi:hypothetical protein
MSWNTDDSYNKIDKSYFKTAIDLSGFLTCRNGDFTIYPQINTTLLSNTPTTGKSTTNTTKVYGNISISGGSITCLGTADTSVVKDSSGNILSTTQTVTGGIINCSTLKLNGVDISGTLSSLSTKVLDLSTNKATTTYVDGKILDLSNIASSKYQPKGNYVGLDSYSITTTNNVARVRGPLLR